MFRPHRRFSHQLSAYIDGRLSEGERRALEGHLEACPSCQRDLQELRATVEALRSLPLAEAPRSFALRPEQVALRPSGRWPAPSLGALAIPMRLAVASLAVALAVLVFVDVGDLGGDGAMTQGTPAAERAAAPDQAQDQTQAAEAPSPPAEGADMPQQAQPEMAPAPEGSLAPPREEAGGGGLDPVRAAEIGLAVALATFVIGYAGLVVCNRRAIRAVIPPKGR